MKKLLSLIFIILITSHIQITATKNCIPCYNDAKVIEAIKNEYYTAWRQHVVDLQDKYGKVRNLIYTYKTTNDVAIKKECDRIAQEISDDLLARVRHSAP